MGLWPTGYQKLACATMNTIFWAGGTFAPKLRVRVNVGGEEVEKDAQALLQEAFLDAWEVLVKAVGGCEAVLGFQVRSIISFDLPFLSVNANVNIR